MRVRLFHVLRVGVFRLNPEQLCQKQAGQVPLCEWPHKCTENDQKSVSQPTDIAEPREQVVRLPVKFLNLYINVDLECRKFVEALRIFRRMHCPGAGFELLLLEHDKIARVLLSKLHKVSLIL